MGEKTFWGYWWLPSEPDTQICGELICKENERLILKLVGRFSTDIIPSLSKVSIIHGSTGKGKRLTLYECYTTHSSLFVRGKNYTKKGQLYFPTSTHSCSYLFEGVHLKEEELVFSGLSLNFENQELWLGERIIDIQPTHKNGKHVVTYTIPDEIEYKLSKFKFKIYYNITKGFSARWVDNKISYSSYIGIEFNEPQKFDEVMKTYNNITNFISFFMGQIAYINSMSVVYKELEENIDVNVLFRKRTDLTNKSHEISPHEMLTTFDQLPNPEMLLNNWFDNLDLIHLLFGLYFSTKYNPDRYITDHFLSMTQAIDTYHIRKNEEKYIEINEFNKLKEKFLEIIQTLPCEEREHFENKVKYMNNKSLRTRLREIGEDFDYLNSILNIFDNTTINKIINTRNYYTHWDPKDELKAIPPIELPDYIKPLRCLILALILNELGLSKEDIIKIVERSVHPFVGG